MEEFEAQFTEKVTLDIERAFEDKAVLNAGLDALERARVVNEQHLPIVDEDTNMDSNVSELDSQVRYLLGTSVQLSGLIQLCHLGDDSEPVRVEDIAGRFKGFAISRRSGQLFYDYLYEVFATEEGDLLTQQEFDELLTKPEQPQLNAIGAQARIDDVYMHFDVFHPTRALAWLTISHPELVNQLDQLLINNSDDETKDLLALRDFRYFTPSTMDQREAKLLKHALAAYLYGMVTLDLEVPYEIILNGSYMVIGEQRTETVNGVKGVMFSPNSLLVLEENNEKNSFGVEGSFYSCGLGGMIHGADIYEESRQVIVPLAHMQSITSMRFPAGSSPSTPEQ